MIMFFSVLAEFPILDYRLHVSLLPRSIQSCKLKLKWNIVPDYMYAHPSA
jgi:hypothetical protein